MPQGPIIVKKGEQPTLGTQLKLALADLEKDQRNSVDNMVRDIKGEINAKIQAKLHEIKEGKIRAKMIVKTIVHNFGCGDNEDAPGIITLLKEYLESQDFINVEFKNISAANSTGYSGIVQFTIPS